MVRSVTLYRYCVRTRDFYDMTSQWNLVRSKSNNLAIYFPFSRFKKWDTTTGCSRGFSAFSDRRWLFSNRCIYGASSFPPIGACDGDTESVENGKPDKRTRPLYVQVYNMHMLVTDLILCITWSCVQHYFLPSSPPALVYWLVCEKICSKCRSKEREKKGEVPCDWDGFKFGLAVYFGHIDGILGIGGTLYTQVPSSKCECDGGK